MEILVVDDNRATRKMVRFALERRGHRVTEADTAHTATSRVTENVPDLILQDLKLPDADGYTFVNALRSLTGGHVPIVAFSADLVSIASIRSAGFDGAIAKPVQPATLAAQVEAHLRRKTAARGASSPSTSSSARESLHGSLFTAPAAHLAQRCAELTSQLAIVEGMTAAVLEEPDVESLLGELLTAWFNAGGLSGGALYLKAPDGSLSLQCLGDWQRAEGAAPSFFGNEERLQETLSSGREHRLSGAELEFGMSFRDYETHEILLTPVHCGETVYGALAAASPNSTWTAWRSLTRSVARRIAQLSVHERLRREQQIATENARRQAALMTALIQNAPDIIVHLDREGTIQFVNRTISKDACARVVGASFLDFVRPAERARIRGILARVFDGEQVTYEIEASDTGDAPALYSCRMGPVRQNGEVVGAVLVCRDISRQRAIEARLRVSDRLAAIGTLAAGVAHEINTPIQYVANNLDFVVACVKALTSAEPSRLSREFALERLPTALADCEDGVKRVAAITHAMRTFSHPGTHHDQIDLNDCLKATVELTRHEWKEIAEVELDLEPDLPAMTGARAELNQVFLNLVINAGHAVEDARRRDGRAGAIRVRSRLDEDGLLRVEISDNGCGIPEAVRSRVYDLFFTTKEVGRGSGQGLALAHAIIEGHGGTIAFETREGEGTTFVLRLPVDGPVDGPIDLPAEESRS